MAKYDDGTSRRIDRVNYPWEMDFRCPSCNGKVRFCYSNPKHEYAEFDGDVCEYRYQYTCKNAGCVMYNVLFNPAPLKVLPRKQYSLAVWKWIAIEAKVRMQKPRQIVERIADEFGILISESTVRKYINEIEVYIAGKIDANTMSMIQAQGHILLSLDGQEPDDDGPTLWLFVDVINNRVLRVVLLEKADHITLHEQVKAILDIYGVLLIGMISDKQSSIVKMHDVFFPEIPHQYCHFHFLQNLWKHIELRDGHVQKELAKVINHLYITSTGTENEKLLENGEKVKIREIFAEIEKDLRKLVKNRSRKFDHLRGIESCSKVEAYIIDIEEQCKQEDPSRYVVKWLMKTVAIIRECLEILRPTNDENILLNKQFQEVRVLLGEPNMTRPEKIAIVDGIFQAMWEDSSKVVGVKSKDALKSFMPKLSSTKDEILLEWVRLYKTHRRGLFAYYDFPGDERTNVAMEKKFSEEKMQLFTRCGKKRVGMHVRIRGPGILKGLYAGKDEIKRIIDEIEVERNYEQIKAGIEELAAKISEETESWRSNIGGINAIKRVLEFGKREGGEED